MAPGAWIRESARVYFGNASAVRDFRTQLRGNRAIWLWGLYLLVLIAFALMAYSQTVSEQNISISEAQRRLQNFYQTTMTLLAVLITLIAPALTATAVVSERQRRSLDLIFSAPVAPKYYLMGKLISSYRYIWMLLVLALPITASCVVLGGATWSDVLQAYALLSLDALLYITVALLFSTVCQKVVSAVLWSYLTLIVYSIVISGIAAASLDFGMFTRSGPQSVPFTACLSPFLVAYSTGSKMILFGTSVPNLILAAIFTLFFTRLLLLGAASALSPTPSKETVALRVQCLAAFGIVNFATAFVLAEIVGRFGSAIAASSSGPLPPSYADPWLQVSVGFGGWMAFLGFITPMIVCYGYDAESKFRPDGWLSIRKTLAGTPSGALPFLLGGLLIAVAGTFLGVMSAGGSTAPDAMFPSYVFWGAGILFLTWSIGRLTSALCNSMRIARVLLFAALIVMWLLPLPFITAMQTYGEPTTKAWDFYMLAPLSRSGSHGMNALVWGGIEFVLGMWCLSLATKHASRAAVRRAEIYG